MENTTKEITKAIISVMKAVTNIEKTSKVGTGNYSYQGVPDKEVKLAFNKAMSDNGLAIIPTEINANSQISTWDQGGSQKRSVFTEVNTKYLLLHESGESIELAGYGHGVDTQDKGAGKATTYALKYALLYTFLTPTGTIDDADMTHSEEIETPETEKTGNSADEKGAKLFDKNGEPGPIKREVMSSEATDKWDGKIIDNKYIMIDGVKIEPPITQIVKLKKLSNYKP